MTRNEVNDNYFEWLLELVCEGRYAKRVHYSRLFHRLQEVEFTYSIPMDSNRAEDGVALRYRFGMLNDYDDNTITKWLGDGPCSLLEMMIALAIRCEEHIMGDPELGNRTGLWFWGMIHNLGLTNMMDFSFDSEYVDEVINRLLNREYGPDGEDGLFTVRHRQEDMREVDIWYQMCWHLNENS